MSAIHPGRLRQRRRAHDSALDERGAATALSEEVPVALGVEPDDRGSVATGITDVIYSRPPATLGQLAPLVVRSAEAGDAVAQALIETAALHLAATARAAAGDERPGVVVLAGSLLTRVPAIGEKVRTSLSMTWPSISLVTSASGEAGAAALAIRWHTGTPVSQPVLEALQAGRSD